MEIQLRGNAISKTTGSFCLKLSFLIGLLRLNKLSPPCRHHQMSEMYIFHGIANGISLFLIETSTQIIIYLTSLLIIIHKMMANRQFYCH